MSKIQSKSICINCFHSYVCEQFNEHRDSGWVNKKCHFFNDHFVPAADVVEVVRCRDCQYRGDYGCPMYYEEDIEWDDDGYTEVDTIIHDRTTDDGFCSYGERREDFND